MAQIKAMYFSPTGTTKRIVTALAQMLAGDRTVEVLDFTTPAGRSEAPACGPDDLLIIGLPTIAGRLPNLLLPYLAGLSGQGTKAIGITLYGNRHYDDAVMELALVLEKGGFAPVAMGAFIGEHSFSRTLAAGRPDASDLAQLAVFAQEVAAKLAAGPPYAPLLLPGDPTLSRYYQPQDRAGNPIDIRKVKPVTSSTCTNCGLCVTLCPMGAIDAADPHRIPGICIKCCACEKSCPVGAKHFADPGYLYHKAELEEGLIRRCEPTWWC